MQGVVRNACMIIVREPEGKVYSGDLAINGKIILKCVLNNVFYCVLLAEIVIQWCAVVRMVNNL
jgi:hypothetical protein